MTWQERAAEALAECLPDYGIEAARAIVTLVDGYLTLDLAQGTQIMTTTPTRPDSPLARAGEAICLGLEHCNHTQPGYDNRYMCRLNLNLAYDALGAALTGPGLLETITVAMRAPTGPGKVAAAVRAWLLAEAVPA